MDQKDRDVKTANRAMKNAGDRGQGHGGAETRAAMTPTTGAPIQHAFAGAELAAEDAAGGGSETDEALRRVAGNDRRV